MVEELCGKLGATGEQLRRIRVTCAEGEMPRWEGGGEDRRESHYLSFTCKLGTLSQLG